MIVDQISQVLVYVVVVSFCCFCGIVLLKLFVEFSYWRRQRKPQPEPEPNPEKHFCKDCRWCEMTGDCPEWHCAPSHQFWNGTNYQTGVSQRVQRIFRCCVKNCGGWCEDFERKEAE